jgi:hypothetical protein
MTGRARASAPDGPTVPDPNQHAIEFAWRAHAAQEAWTAKVDAKASLLLALEGGLLVAALAGHTKDGPLAGLHGGRNAAQGIGMCLLLLAIGMAAGAVIPMLGRVREHRASHESNTIYFGHVRHWDPPCMLIDYEHRPSRNRPTCWRSSWSR